MKKDTSLFSLRNIRILTNMQKKFFEILVQTALTVGLFWTILKLTPKSALLYFTILHGQRTPRESFFSKFRKFWAWADKLGRNFMRHLGYFWPNYKHYFGTVSSLSMGKCSWFYFLQDKLGF